jgi:hypothetical protein
VCKFIDVFLPSYCATDHFDGAKLATERTHPDGTHDMPKHVGGDLQTPGV